MDPLRPPLLKRLRRAHWIVLDCLVAVLLVLWHVTVWRDLAFMRGPQWVGAVILAIAVGSAGLRRYWPQGVLALLVAGQFVANLIGAPAQPALAVAFAIYLIPLRRPRRVSLGLLAGALFATSAGFVVSAHVPHSAPSHNVGGALLVNTLLVVVAWMIGDSVRQQRLYSAEVRDREVRRAREDLAEARRAVSEERLQIARELHDVGAHTMSVIAIQAGVANYVVSEHPDEAARTLASIEATSRDALREMRSLLRILRADGDDGQPEGGLAPAPGLADLCDLIARTAEAGLRVDLDVGGERPALPAGLDLAAFRVVQEAITNVIRHAATDCCQVTIRYEIDELALEICDRGSGSFIQPTTNAGHGIIGMRERVAMYGGAFHAGPLRGRGFRVAARFPLANGGL